MSWAQRLWLVLLLAVASGGIAAILGGNAVSGHVGALILGALGSGALIVLVVELLSTHTRPATHSPLRVLVGMLVVLIPAAVVASIILGTPTPIVIVVVFGGMAAPIMLRRR